MMRLSIYQVDAFADERFRGNPAAVCPLVAWIPDELMQQIAMENNLSETAFFVQEDSPMEIRWFTPTVEVDLCGHATLASAHVLSKHLGFMEKEIAFTSRSGPISVRVNEADYTLDFPLDTLTELPSDHAVSGFFTAGPQQVFRGISDYLLVFPDEADIRQISVDFNRLAHFDGRGVIITSPATGWDFISRGFYPQSGINEDPATGSAQTTLAAYWSEKTGRNRFRAKQVSSRGGTFGIEKRGDRVLITGSACTYMTGKLSV